MAHATSQTGSNRGIRTLVIPELRTSVVLMALRYIEGMGAGSEGEEWVFTTTT